MFETAWFSPSLCFSTIFRNTLPIYFLLFWEEINKILTYTFPTLLSHIHKQKEISSQIIITFDYQQIWLILFPDYYLKCLILSYLCFRTPEYKYSFRSQPNTLQHFLFPALFLPLKKKKNQQTEHYSKPENGQR